MLRDDRTLDLAARIADGSGIDWNAESVEAHDPAMLRELQSIGAVATLLRTPLESLDQEGSQAGRSWGPLTVTAKVGEGRFGEVYEAWDSRLLRRVALKLLRAPPAAAPRLQADSAIEEARLLARVRHPNVLTIHGAECVDGRVGIWTEFIEGVTLEGLLAERGPLPVAEVVQIGLTVCNALGAVHAAGLLHRDIKAQNVMRETGGRIVLMDFGTSLEPAAIAGRAVPLSGTPLYLAPELLKGADPSVRSDIYSLGVLLFHLLTGAFPVAGESLADIRHEHEQGRRATVGVIRSDVPQPFQRAIDRLLAANPNDRPESLATVHAQLQASRSSVSVPTRWALAAAAVLLVGVTMAATWRGRDFETQRPLASTDIVVVANFENRTDEPGLGIALAYATSEALRSTGRIQVAERARVEDTLALMGKAVETAIEEGLAREVAIRDGGIRAVAVGSIELSNPGYHLQLLIRDPSSGAVLKRAEGTARDRDALLAEVRDLARVVSAAPLPDRHVADPALEPVTTASLDALRLYTESFYAGGRSQWPAARDLAAEAIAKDPAFPSAQIWMAWCLRNTGGPPSEYMPYAARAMELSDQVQPWERLWIRASYFTFAGADEDAIGAYQALTRLRPDHPWSIGNLMTLWQRLGQRETAVALLPPAADRRPHDFLTNAYAADVLAIWNKDVAGAREYAKRAAALAPRDPRDGRLAGYTTWVSELKYFESWVNGDLQPAGRHVADTMSGEMSGGERMQDARLKSAGLFALTLGQLRNARTLFLRMSNSRLSQRADYLARVAFESDAPDEARRQLRELIASSPTQAGRQVGTQMAWLGLRKETEQILRNMGQAPGQARAGIAGTAKLAAGDAKAAIPLLAESIAWARASGHHAFFLHCELLAQAYVAEQRTSEAIEVLEAAGRDMARAYPGYADQYGSSGYLWLRTQAALLPLYHNAKREIDEAQLRSMLVSFLRLSDDDHPIRRQLEASAREH